MHWNFRQFSKFWVLMAVHCNLGRFPKHLEPAMSFHHPAQAFHTELSRVLIQQYYYHFNYFANSNLIIIITTIRCMSQKVWGFMHQTASPTCIKARQSLSKWDESLLRRSFARFRLKVNSSTFQVIFFKFYEYLWLYLYVFSILFLWLYE